ncbi:MAG TPA: hypothetical protein VI114_08815 [Chthoniobacterales bacterium]
MNEVGRRKITQGTNGSTATYFVVRYQLAGPCPQAVCGCGLAMGAHRSSLEDDTIKNSYSVTDVLTAPPNAKRQTPNAKRQTPNGER